MALEDITPATREEEFLDRIARAAASPNLPEVDASDNGDVLTVVDGAWAASTPGGGAAALIVEVNNQTFTKTAAEIISALPLVYIYYPITDSGFQTYEYSIINSYIISDGTAQGLPTDPGYYFLIIIDGSNNMFYAPTLNDYPASIK